MQPALLRIIDANANRAAEGLRVMEDVARFALDDAELVTRCKTARHSLRIVVANLPGGRSALLAARDTPGDVGTRIKAKGSEDARASLDGVVAAASGRSAEGLRAVEEALKLARKPEAARVIESVRYGLYETDKRMGLALGTGRAPQWRLCVLITESLCKRSWLDVARAAIDGGADCLQLREKELNDSELFRRAKALVRVAKGRAAVIVNDHALVAAASGADGVHLGQEDLPVSAVRAALGSRLLIGVSTHTLEEARRALQDGADYAGVGAMFPTATKVRKTSGVKYLRQYLAYVKGKRPLPHLAIGGITPGNVKELTKAGCRGVAVSSVVCGAEDPARVCRSLIGAISRKADSR